jgi:Putative auto-transporter adhesin, head GIN domain
MADRSNDARMPSMSRRLTFIAAASCLFGVSMRKAMTAAPDVREIDLPAFDKLFLQVPADVEIVIGEKNHARIEAERKVVDSIDFRARGGALQVVARRSFETRERIHIRITCRSLVALEAHASVDATLSDLGGERLSLSAADSATVSLERLNLSVLEADIAGSATVTASGKVRMQTVRIGGAGGYDARRLESQTVVVDASGSSDVVIDSRDSLDAKVSGAATVQYGGNPKLKQSVDGAGTLERR